MAIITITLDEQTAGVGMQIQGNLSRVTAFGMLEVARDTLKDIFDNAAKEQAQGARIAVVPASALGNGRNH